MTDKTNLIREIHEYVTAHGGENTATHLLVQAASAIQTQAAELEAVGAGGVSGPLMGIAAPPTAQAEGWRPIETAPKDCQAILVTEGRFCHCVEWNEEFDWWAVDDNKLGPYRLRGSSPTHWMPLPPPPTSAEGVEHG